MKHLKTAWKHIRRSPYQALAAISIMVLTFFATSFVLILGFGSQKILEYFEKKPQITVFFRDEAGEQEIEVLKKSMENSGKVENIKYISKEEALKIYQQQYKDDPLLLEMVTAQILPASLEISAKDPLYLKDIYEIVKKEPFIEDIIYQRDIVENLLSWTQTLRKIGAGIIIFLALVSVLIVLLVVSMKIALRRQEIEILGLLGASNWYIRWPFILEGIFYGILGSLIAWGISCALLFYSLPFLESFLSGIPLLSFNIFLMLKLLGMEMVLGIFLGAAGSFFAIWKYLK